MIKVDIFDKRLSSKKCLKSNVNLNDDEYLISRKSFPNLYENKCDIKEKPYIKNILSFIHKNNQYILKNMEKDLKLIQMFFNLLFDVGVEYINEREIHLYIFLFWEEIIWDKKIIKDLNRENFFYEGQVRNEEDKFQKNLLPHISKNCDLIYHDKEEYSIELIEIKNVDIDDRAISQIQRYYRKTNQFCENKPHNLKIINIKPTLIINHTNILNKKEKISLLEYWQTFPTYFREFLNIYSFEFCKNNKILKISNLKPKLKSLCKEVE